MINWKLIIFLNLLCFQTYSMDLQTALIYLERDYSPIESQSLPPSGLSGDIDQQLQQQSEHYDEQARLLDQAREEDDILNVTTEPIRTLNDTDSNKKVLGVHWEKLEKCLQNVKKPFRRAVSLRLKAPDSQELKQLEEQLKLFRSGTEQGYLCGEFFEAQQAHLMGKTNQLKLILTLEKVLSHQYLVKRLLEAFWAGFHSKAPIESRSLWRLIYHRRVYQAYFNIEMESDEILKRMLKEDLENRVKDIESSHFELRPIDVEKYFDLGQKFTRPFFEGSK